MSVLHSSNLLVRDASNMYTLSVESRHLNKGGPIIIIDDDPDDQELMKDIFLEISQGQEIIQFRDGASALQYLHQPQVNPFLILSDLNMPGLAGFEVRKKVFDDPLLREKCVPYIFMTTGAIPNIVKRAYHMSIQGIFQKPSSVSDWHHQLSIIVSYWKLAKSPNRLD